MSEPCCRSRLGECEHGFNPIDEVKRVEQEIARLTAQVTELKADLYSQCAECGSDDPDLANECPMKKAKEEAERLRAQVTELKAANVRANRVAAASQSMIPHTEAAEWRARYAATREARRIERALRQSCVYAVGKRRCSDDAAMEDVVVSVRFSCATHHRGSKPESIERELDEFESAHALCDIDAGEEA